MKHFMLNFKAISMTDQEKIAPCLAANTARVNERSFASMYIWGRHYGFEVCVQDGVLYTHCLPSEGHRIFLSPVGPGDTAGAFEKIHEDSLRLGQPYRVYCLTADEAGALERRYPGRYDIRSDRDNFDYVYRREDLAELQGKKYHGKRNHIKKFLSAYDGRWKYRPVEPARDFETLLDFQKKWQQSKDKSRQADYQHELYAIEQALRHYDALGIRGGVLEVEGAVAAFTLGVPLTGDTMDVLIEKADAGIEGAYPMINREFVRCECGGFSYIDREEDMGIEGLRRAKLSYYPAMFTEKFIASPKEQGRPL